MDDRLTVRELIAVSRRVAADCEERLEVLGVIASEGASDRAELIIQMSGCQTEPCKFVLNLSRNMSTQALAAELTRKLRDALQHHRAGR